VGYFRCALAHQLWFRLLQPLGLVALTPEREMGLAGWWLQRRCRLDPSARPIIFNSCLLLVAWCIWKERNAVTFYRRRVSDALTLARVVAKEAEDWVLSGFANY
jgi:hypothetical protein